MSPAFATNEADVLGHSWPGVVLIDDLRCASCVEPFPLDCSRGVWIWTVNGKPYVLMMSRNRVVGYFTSHFLGNQSLAMSFFVNGVLFCLLMISAVVGLAYTLGHFGILTDIGVPVGIVLLCGLAWSLTGNVLAAAKALKNPSSSRLKKAFAVGILCAVILTVVYIVRNVLHLGSLYG